MLNGPIFAQSIMAVWVVQTILFKFQNSKISQFFNNFYFLSSIDRFESMIYTVLTYLSLLIYPLGLWSVPLVAIAVLLHLAALYPIFYLVFILYPLWTLVNADQAVTGRGRVESWRQMAVFRYIANYFPVKLHKTSELDPDKCYILAHFPHGCICYANVINFGTDGSGVSKLFPGISVSPLTLDINFYLPLLREFLVKLGFGSVSAKSIHYRLTKLKGQAISIVIGGAAEAALTDPNEPYICQFSQRKGFIKLAMKTGFLNVHN